VTNAILVVLALLMVIAGILIVVPMYSAYPLQTSRYMIGVVLSSLGLGILTLTQLPKKQGGVE